METTTKKPMYELVKAIYHHNELRIMDATSISEPDYRALVFETGCQYAELMTDNDAQGCTLLTSSKYFWAWWRNEWNKRNALFIYHFNMDAGKLLGLSYRLFQSADRFCYGALNEKKYCCLIGEVLQESREREVI